MAQATQDIVNRLRQMQPEQRRAFVASLTPEQRQRVRQILSNGGPSQATAPSSPASQQEPQELPEGAEVESIGPGRQFLRQLTGISSLDEARQLSEQMASGPRIAGVPSGLLQTAAMLPIGIGSQMAQTTGGGISRIRELLSGQEPQGFEERAGAARELQEGIRETLLGLIPALGPQGEELFDLLEQGDVSEALAGTVGFFAPFMGGRALRGAGRLANRTVGEPFRGLAGAEEIPLRFSQRENVGPIGRGAQPLVALAETFSEKSIFGTARAARFVDIVEDRLRSVVDQTFDSIAGRRLGENAIQDGRAVREAVENTRQLVKEASGNAIDDALRNLDEAGVLVPTDDLRASAARRLKSLEKLRQEGGIPGSVIKAEIDLLRKTANMAEEVRPSVLHRRRSELLRVSRVGGTGGDTPSQGLARSLAGETDDTLTQAARQVGGEEAADNLRRALGEWRELNKKVNKEVVRRIMESDAPERFGGLMLDVGSDSIRELKRGMNPSAFRQLKRGTAEQLFERASKRETVTSALQDVGGRVGIQQTDPRTIRILDGDRLQGLLNDVEGGLGGGKAELIFGKDGVKRLSDLATLAKKVRESGGLSDIKIRFPEIVTAGVDSGIVFGSIFGTFPGGRAGALAGGTGINLMSKIMLNPKPSRPFFKALKAAGESNLPKFAFWFARTQQAMIDEGIVEDDGRFDNAVERIKAAMEAVRGPVSPRGTVSPFGLPNPGGIIREQQLQEQDQ